MDGRKSVGIVGATGYVGGVLVRAYGKQGWSVVSIVRNPRGEASQARWDMADTTPQRLPAGLDVLVHCAYDRSVMRRSQIWDVNVDGTTRLLEAAQSAGIARCIVISSISAFEGTRQRYGEAKLAIEDVARYFGAIAVRPGLVWGPDAGGMVGSLRRVLRLPLVPVLAGQAQLLTVHQDDLAAAVVALSTTDTPPAGPLVVAHPQPVRMRRLLESLARRESRSPLLVPMPWQPAYALLRLAEAAGLHPPFSADSLWGLAHPARYAGDGVLEGLGVPMRPFSGDRVD